MECGTGLLVTVRGLVEEPISALFVLVSVLEVSGASLPGSKIQQLLRSECIDSDFFGAFLFPYCLTCPFYCRFYFVTFQVSEINDWFRLIF